MARRITGLVVLGLLMTLLCLALGGTACVEDNASTYRLRCEDLDWPMHRCRDLETLKCYLVNYNGGIVEKPCIVLPGELEAEMERAKREPLR